MFSSSREWDVRTDYILQNTFAHFLDPTFFQTLPAINLKEKNILIEIVNIIKDFEKNSAIKNLCLSIKDVMYDDIETTLSIVYNELFSEGIAWSKIVAWFIFVGELTNIGVFKKNKENFSVNRIFTYFSEKSKKQLEIWVCDHGGWEGILTLKNSTTATKDVKEKNSTTNNSRKLFNLIIETIILIVSVPVKLLRALM